MMDVYSDKSQIFDRYTLRWPKAKDRLLMPGRDIHIADCIDERSYRLLKGYKRAGDILVQQALSDRTDSENLVFPALFNYRHFIELALKSIIEKHGPFAGITDFNRNHRLPELWSLFLKIAISFHDDPEELAAVGVGKCIRELAKIDANSTAFRYVTNLDGEISTLPDWLDLTNLHDVMNGIENFFECADLGFSEKTQHAFDQSYDQTW